MISQHEDQLGNKGHWAPKLGIATAITLALLAGLAPSEVEAAKRNHTFRVWLDNTCIGGRAPAGSKLRVTWKKASGTVKKKGTVRTNKKGKWSLCRRGKVVRAGDRLSAKLGGYKRTARVPRMDLDIDRDGDIVSGRTKANRSLIVQHCYWRERYGNNRCDYKSVKTSADGRFSVDMESTTNYGDIRGGDRIEVFTIGGRKKHTFGRDQFAPYVDVLLGGSDLTGAYVPGASLTVRLLDASRDEKAVWSGLTSASKKVWSGVYGGRVRIAGMFVGRFAPNGQQVKVGDMVASVVLPPTPGLPIYDIDLTADAATDVVEGTCATETRYTLLAKSPDGTKRSFALAMTKGQDGQFRRDLTGKFNLKKGSTVRLTCHFRTGDRVSKSIVAA